MAEPKPPGTALVKATVTVPKLAAHVVPAADQFMGMIAAMVSAASQGSAVAVEKRVFLTLEGAAEFSGLPVRYLRRLMSSGELRAVKTGGGWRIPRAALERLAQTLTETTTDTAETERAMENKARRTGNSVAWK